MKSFTESLRPIVRDRAGPIEPLAAALAAITGQPLSEIDRVLGGCRTELAGLAGVGGRVSDADAIHASLQRLGFKISRLYVDARCSPALGQLLNVYRWTEQTPEPMIAICESGDVFAFFASEVSAWTKSTSSSIDELICAGVVDLDEPVRFAMSVGLHREVPIVQPDRAFLRALATSAFALAAAYNIGIEMAKWPFWVVTFPEALRDGPLASPEASVCGEHELLMVISDRVRLFEQAHRVAEEAIARFRV